MNDITDNTVAEAARLNGLIIDRQREGSMAMLLARDLRRPPSDLELIIALGIESGAGYQMLFDEFKDAMRDSDDIDYSIHQKIQTIIAHMRSTMEALEIEGIEPTAIDDDRSGSLRALAPEQADIALEIIDAVRYQTKKVMLLQGSVGTGKMHTVRISLSELYRLGIHCLVSATTGIAAVQYPGAICSCSVLPRYR
jgi:hypothetical protein